MSFSFYEHSKKRNIHFTLPQTKIKGISHSKIKIKMRFLKFSGV